MSLASVGSYPHSGAGSPNAMSGYVWLYPAQHPHDQRHGGATERPPPTRVWMEARLDEGVLVWTDASGPGVPAAFSSGVGFGAGGAGAGGGAGGGGGDSGGAHADPAVYKVYEGRKGAAEWFDYLGNFDFGPEPKFEGVVGQDGTSVVQKWTSVVSWKEGGMMGKGKGADGTPDTGYCIWTFEKGKVKTFTAIGADTDLWVKMRKGESVEGKGTNLPSFEPHDDPASLFWPVFQEWGKGTFAGANPELSKEDAMTKFWHKDIVWDFTSTAHPAFGRFVGHAGADAGHGRGCCPARAGHR